MIAKRGVVRFGKRGKLSPIFIGPFEILERIGTVAHVVDWGKIEVDTDGTFEEGPVCILDSRDQVLWRKTMTLVRVLWRHYGVEESTWEREDTMRDTNPFLFSDESTWFSRLRFK